jgi:hypothetical protein
VAVHEATTPLMLYTSEGYAKYRFGPSKHIGQALPCPVPVGSLYGASTNRNVCMYVCMYVCMHAPFLEPVFWLISHI